MDRTGASALLGALGGTIARIEGLVSVDYVTSCNGRLCVLIPAELTLAEEERHIAAALFWFMVDHSSRSSIIQVYSAMLDYALTSYREIGD